MPELNMPAISWKLYLYVVRYTEVTLLINGHFMDCKKAFNREVWFAIPPVDAEIRVHLYHEQYRQKEIHIDTSKFVDRRQTIHTEQTSVQELIDFWYSDLGENNGST